VFVRRCKVWPAREVKSHIFKLTTALAISVMAGACQPAGKEATSMKAKTPTRVREAAVAGLFYQAEPERLAQNIDFMLASTHVEAVGELKAVIAPHAGYQFSGLTAAHAYKLMAGRDYKTVLLLAPSHYALFDGVYVTDTEAYRTPLGDMLVSPRAAQLAKLPPFTSQPNAMVQRPGWWQQSPATAPAAGKDTPETWEHSGEVQVPFLQKVLPRAELIPVVFGRVDPALAARTLATQLDDQTIIVASSDLSHYHPYADARARDTKCIEDILALKTELPHEGACGAGPILAVINLAREKGWKPKLLDYRNSGDATGNTNTTVVGYTAIAFFAAGDERFNAAERRQLLDLARQSVTAAARNSVLPVLEASYWPEKLRAPGGCFVTLNKRGQLRGCIGNILPGAPLYKAVTENARGAALHDSRFPPVSADELSEIEIEVSVLTPPQPLAFSSPADLLAKLKPHRDGVVLQVQGSSSTFLPQVWSQLPDKEQFLNHLSQKAGRPADAWRQPGTQVMTYQVEAFHEHD